MIRSHKIIYPLAAALLTMGFISYPIIENELHDQLTTPQRISRTKQFKTKPESTFIKNKSCCKVIASNTIKGGTWLKITNVNSDAFTENQAARLILCELLYKAFLKSCQNSCSEHLENHFHFNHSSPSEAIDDDDSLEFYIEKTELIDVIDCLKQINNLIFSLELTDLSILEIKNAISEKDALGESEIINLLQITPDEVRAFYQKWTDPQFMQFTVVSDLNRIEINEALALSSLTD